MADPKCNADEQIFSQSAAGLIRLWLKGEVGQDLVKPPVYEIEKQLLLSGAAS